MLGKYQQQQYLLLLHFYSSSSRLQYCCALLVDVLSQCVSKISTTPCSAATACTAPTTEVGLIGTGKYQQEGAKPGTTAGVHKASNFARDG